MIDPLPPTRRVELAPPTEEAEEEIREEKEIEEPESRRLGQKVLGSEVRYNNQRI
jgi:hypothetical protein